MLIKRIWSGQPGKYFFLCTKSRGRWREHSFSRSEFAGLQNFVDENKDKDIYFCPHGFSERRRKEQFAVAPTMLWADMDEADPREVAIKPTVAIESSPGRYVGLWSIDAPATKSVNRRLTYFLGADKGGWDLTQVLRVPNTTNYKYTSTPRVRTLWTDGPEYTLKQIERKLPQEDDSDEDEGDAEDVYKRYEKSLAPWLRRELLAGKPTAGKRSEMLWKLNNALLEAGVSRDDCFTLLKASPWNKFKGRDDQLRKEIEKSSGSKFKKNAAPSEASDYKFLSRSLADVEEEEIDWVWYPYLAKGELSILEGDPGVGKSYLAQMVCAALVDGKRLPSVKRLPIVQGKIAYFDMENSAGSVTKKRLSTNGLKNFGDYYQEEQPFSIDDEEALDQVYDAIEKQKPLAVVFDTLNTYIGKADIHKSSETQQAFTRFRDIAKRFNVAVLVLRHLTKGSRDRALYRGQGSIAFAGLARVVMTVGLMPEDPETRVMAVTKINVTRPPRALSYTITELPDTIREKDRSKFEWGEFVDISSDDLCAPPSTEKKTSERDEAKKFLEDLLRDGPVELKKIEQACETRSISIRTIHRAADAMGVLRESKGFGKDKRAIWKLADDKSQRKKNRGIRVKSR